MTEVKARVAFILFANFISICILPYAAADQILPLISPVNVCLKWSFGSGNVKSEQGEIPQNLLRPNYTSPVNHEGSSRFHGIKKPGIRLCGQLKT